MSILMNYIGIADNGKLSGRYHTHAVVVRSRISNFLNKLDNFPMLNDDIMLILPDPGGDMVILGLRSGRDFTTFVKRNILLFGISRK
jgi:hypothetical protein